LAVTLAVTLAVILAVTLAVILTVTLTMFMRFHGWSDDVFGMRKWMRISICMCNLVRTHQRMWSLMFYRMRRSMAVPRVVAMPHPMFMSIFMHLAAMGQGRAQAIHELVNVSPKLAEQGLSIVVPPGGMHQV
jgi:hypothetical protein